MGGGGDEERPASEASDLGPLEWYDDEYSPPEILAAFRPGADASATGPRSQTGRAIIWGSCAGWPDPPASEEVVRPHLGGGTVLAARLRHRLSTDIDVFLPGRYSLIGLAQEDEANIIRRLGGTAESVSGVRSSDPCRPRGSRKRGSMAGGRWC